MTDPADTTPGTGPARAHDEPGTPSPVTPASAMPSPADLARRAPRPAAASEADPAPGTVEPATAALAYASRGFGEIDPQGRVFVRDGDTRRELGVWAAGDAAAGLDFYVQRHLGMHAELDLLQQRLAAGKVAPADAHGELERVKRQIDEAPGIGDLEALRTRLGDLHEAADAARAERAAAKKAAAEKARSAKEDLIAEAEKLSASNDWRGGVARFRALLDTWKSLPRLDKAADDQLWHRFSAARTAYTRRRKAHFGEVHQRRDEAEEAKKHLVAEAEELAVSTDWGTTGRRMRTLMDRWKSAGGAARDADERLWRRFRAAQDTFYEARTAHFAAQDAEFEQNAKAKEQILEEAEALVPVTDLASARSRLRDLQDRWSQAGKVPRESMRSLESRMRAVEKAVADAESEQWQRSNPEMRARAQSTVDMLRTAVSDLETRAAAAHDSGDEQARAEADEALAARRSWLEQAEKALADYS